MELLDAYIGGYFDRHREIDKDFHTKIVFFPDFQNYVQKHYNIDETSQRWCMIINLHSSSEEEAFDKFFELLDNYLDDFKRANEN